MARSQTIFLPKRSTSFGRAAAGAVAVAYALPSMPRAALRSSSGRLFASLGRTRESGESGMPSSPTEVFSRNFPLICSSESRVAANTLPVTWEISS